MSAIVSFLDGDKPIARFELSGGMVAPVQGQTVVIRGHTYEVQRVVLDFSPSIPDVTQVVLCKVRRTDAGVGARRGAI
jgi:hypothetical protein